MTCLTTSEKLYSAVIRGNVEEVIEILAYATPNEVNHREGNENERTALAEAVVSNNIDIVRALLQYPGLDANLPNQFNVLPLMSSFTAEMTTLLLSHPAVNANVLGKERSLRIACEEGNLGIVRVLLAQGGYNINAQNKDGVTALIYATSQNFEAIAKELLSHPHIDVNAQDITGFSALLYACYEGNCPAVLPLLLQHPHINVNIRHEQGGSSLFLACTEGHINAVARLLQTPNIDVNMPNYKGYTPLLKAADRGYKEICAMLLQYPGIDVNMQSEEGFTALICAAQHGHVEIVKNILVYAALQSPIMYHSWPSPKVSALDDVKLVHALLEHRVVDVNIQ